MDFAKNGFHSFAKCGVSKFGKIQFLQNLVLHKLFWFSKNNFICPKFCFSAFQFAKRRSYKFHFCFEKFSFAKFNFTKLKFVNSKRWIVLQRRIAANWFWLSKIGVCKCKFTKTNFQNLFLKNTIVQNQI